LTLYHFCTKFTLCTTRHDLLWNQKYGSGTQHQPMDRAFHATGTDLELCSEISDTVNNVPCRGL